jgi:hypothetical protein
LVAKVPPLLDAHNVRHAVQITRCACGCVLLRSDDDPSVTWFSGDWESEDQVDLRCRDRECSCHGSRLVDLRSEELRILVLGSRPSNEQEAAPA